MQQDQSEDRYVYRPTIDPWKTHRYLLDPVCAYLRERPRIQRLLDVGCGDGTLTAKYLPHAERVFAVDMSVEGVEQARGALGVAQVALASAYDDWTVLFAGVSSYDAIVSTEVVEHLYDPRAFVRRAHEALVPGGRLILTTPYHGYFKNLLIAASGKHDAHYAALWDGGHIKFWSRNTLTELLSEAGFQSVRFVGAGRVPYLWKSMVLTARRP